MQKSRTKGVIACRDYCNDLTTTPVSPGFLINGDAFWWCTGWIRFNKANGLAMPTPAQVSQGPFVVETAKLSGDGELESGTTITVINKHFMDALFRLMPGAAGASIWNGSTRCQRCRRYYDENYHDFIEEPGTFEEMCTFVDQAFVCWTYECYYDDLVKMFQENETSGKKISPQNLNGKWLVQGSSVRYDGWTEDGKREFNRLVEYLRTCIQKTGENNVIDVPQVEWRSAETDGRQVKVITGTVQKKASAEFRDMFKKRWDAEFLSNLMKNGGKRYRQSNQSKDQPLVGLDLASDFLDVSNVLPGTCWNGKRRKTG